MTTTSPSTNATKDKHVPICKCALCGGPKSWEWEEAFYKEGFDNGVNSQTSSVMDVLTDAGYQIGLADYDANTFINSIKSANGTEQILEHTWIGEADPRTFLPPHLITLLDNTAFADAPASLTAELPVPFHIDAPRSSDEMLVVNIG